MIGYIARKEILESLATYRFFILTGMLLVLMVVSIIVSYGDYELRLENYNLNRPKPHTSNVMIPPTPYAPICKPNSSASASRFLSTSGSNAIGAMPQKTNQPLRMSTA